MKTIFLTGATGAMGADATRVLLECGEFKLRILSHNTKRSQRVLKPYLKNPLLTVIKGDLVNYDDVKKAMGQADYVIHLGGMVSPSADYYPELTMKVNIESMANIIKAIKESGRADDIKLVTIGSVAMHGNRSVATRWARVGDPIRVSEYDHYGISKVIAERMLIESGLKHWVSLRQNGVLHSGLMDKIQAVMFHVPYDCCLEWVTAYDSAVLLRNICRPSTPESFWNNVYAIGGGEKCRIVQHDVMTKMFNMLGIKDYTKVFNLNWFATQNFHGYWSADSHELNDLFQFQSQDPDGFFEETYKNLPFYYKLAKLTPAPVMKYLVFKPTAYFDSQGPMHWVRKKNDGRVKAFFGGYDKQSNISKKWSSVDRTIPDQTIKCLDHGYDYTKKLTELSLEEIAKAAEFRGGKLLSTSYSGDVHEKLQWQCSCGEQFEGSVLMVLRAGHWCPKCDINWEAYEPMSKKSPFFAQVFNQ